jgi:hypothetical protein
VVLPASIKATLLRSVVAPVRGGFPGFLGKAKLQQTSFREAVITAYNGRCAI